MQARRALRHFPYGGGKIEHLILCCHSVKTFAGAKVRLFFEIRKEKKKKSTRSYRDEQETNKTM